MKSAVVSTFQLVFQRAQPPFIISHAASSSPQIVRRKKLRPNSGTLNPNNMVLFACCGLTGFLGRITQCNRPDATQGFRQLPLSQEILAAFAVKISIPDVPLVPRPRAWAASIIFSGRNFNPQHKCLQESHLQN